MQFYGCSKEELRDPVWFGGLSQMMPRLKAENGLFFLALMNSGNVRELANRLTATSQGLTGEEYDEARTRAQRAALEARAAFDMMEKKRDER